MRPNPFRQANGHRGAGGFRLPETLAVNHEGPRFAFIVPPITEKLLHAVLLK